MKIIRLILFFPLSLVYDLISSLRNTLFDLRIIPSVRHKIPVISIGNLSMGGTGKTPMTEYIARLLYDDAKKVAILSRGYKRKSKGFLLLNDLSDAEDAGDEALQYFKRSYCKIVAVCESRNIGVVKLLEHYPDIDVILLDDAFQHRYLKPSLSLLLTDFNRPFFSDFIFPSGNLRESSRFAQRADIIIVSKCPENINEDIKERMYYKLKINNEQSLFFAAFEYRKPCHFIDKTTLELSEKYSVLLFTGIANPQTIEHYLSSRVGHLQTIRFKDHHDYSEKDIERIISVFEKTEHQHKILISTEKDGSRLMNGKFRHVLVKLPLYLLPVELVILFDQKNEFNEKIKSLC